MSREDRQRLLALSPLDGRYQARLGGFAERHFSELALIRRRVEVEAAWLRLLADHPGIGGGLGRDAGRRLDAIVGKFSAKDAQAVKAIERRTNHDVKAAELWLRNRVARTPLARHSALIHFGCTSADINNLALSLMAKDATDNRVAPALDGLLGAIAALATRHARQPMLAHTHGQPASPTTLGKEFSVFARRLRKQVRLLGRIRLEGKMNGAVGNYNAHTVAYPGIDWQGLSRSFVESLGLAHNSHTTQIEPYDSLAELFDCLSRVNSILVDMCRDAWTYISLDYLRQRPVKAEVGSSTMPHKVNPIDFENAEGNLGVSSALLRHLGATLPVSRLQRDLTDSTVSRNIGVAFGHMLVGIDSAHRGLEKVDANPERMARDLDGNWQVLAEAVMSVMRAHGVADAYEKVKARTRGKGALGKDDLREIVRRSPLPEKEKRRLLAMTPADYTGIASRLARKP